MKSLTIKGFRCCNFEDIKEDILNGSLSVYFEESKVTVNFFKLPFKNGIERVYAEKTKRTDTFKWPYFQLQAIPVALIYNNELTLISDCLDRWQLFSNLPKEFKLFDFSLEMQHQIVENAISEVSEGILDDKEREEVAKTALLYYLNKPFKNFRAGNFYIYNEEADLIETENNFLGKFTNTDDWKEKATQEFLKQSFVSSSKKTILVSEHMQILKARIEGVKKLYQYYCNSSGDHTILKDMFDKAKIKGNSVFCSQQYEIVLKNFSFRMSLAEDSFIMKGSKGFVVLYHQQKKLEEISKMAEEPDLTDTKLLPICKIEAIRSETGSLLWKNC